MSAFSNTFDSPEEILKATIVGLQIERANLKIEIARLTLDLAAVVAELEAWKRAQTGLPACFNCGAPCYNANHGKAPADG